ncbi:MAG: adenosine deaminase [Eubacteriales bacterium]|nr:adenosine deaminase [Eubacteriales bacterium]
MQNSNIEWIEKLECLTDLHVHLDGSLSKETVKHLAKMQNIDTGRDRELAGRLSVSSDCKDLNEYLEKFEFPLKLLQTRDAIRYSVCELVRIQEEQGVIYSEIRFAPQLHMRKGLSQQEVVEAACEGIIESKKYWKAYSCHNLILCCMRSDSNKYENMETIRLAALYAEKGYCVVAADLAGAEGLYATDTFTDVFRDAVQRGVPFTIHAGEAAGADSIECALHMQAGRIGHGIRCIESEAVMEQLAKSEIALELCPTSNLNTRIYESIEEYPIQQLINKGIKVTVNTDNMTVSDTTEARELALVADTFNMEKKDVKQLIMNSVEAAFAPEAIKNRLRARVETQFAKVTGIRG